MFVIKIKGTEQYIVEYSSADLRVKFGTFEEAYRFLDHETPEKIVRSLARITHFEIIELS